MLRRPWLIYPIRLFWNKIAQLNLAGSNKITNGGNNDNFVVAVYISGFDIGNSCSDFTRMIG